MPSLTRRALVALAALCRVAFPIPAGSAATGPGPPPPPPELDAFLDRGAYRGDLNVMLEKGVVRVLTAYSKTGFFVDGAETGGVTYEYMRAFEAFLRKRQRAKRAPQVAVHFVPVSRDRLIPALLAGEGDLVAANLTVTPERRAEVDFSDPYLKNVREVVITGPASPEVATLDDLAGQEVWVRRSSSYWASLEALNRRLTAAERAPAGLVAVDEHLEDEDLLEMLNVGLIPLTVVDDHKARLWTRLLPDIRVREDLALREGGEIAFAIRERSPRLKAALDAFVAKHGKGTTFGNVVFGRYLGNADHLRNAASRAGRRKLERVIELFRRYGDRYGFDPLMLAAQGYQELRLDNAVRSKAGAVGIMQVLPTTAKDPSVDIADVKVLENNVHAAAKYMRYVMDTYFPEAKMDPFNRTMFAFASYNAGPARIAGLRRQAAGRGVDPDQWFGQVEQVAAERIGRETVQYVGNILKYYVVYRRVADLHARKEKALEAARAGPP